MLVVDVFRQVLAGFTRGQVRERTKKAALRTACSLHNLVRQVENELDAKCFLFFFSLSECCLAHSFCTSITVLTKRCEMLEKLL